MNPADARAAGNGGPGAALDAKGAVLVVDDSPDMRTLLATLLAADGHEVRLSSSGEEALAAVLAHPPDLILLDIRMPGLDGFEVCRRLKSEPSSRDIPILFISAVTDSAEKVGAFELGAADFITKPIQDDEVRIRVRTQLTLRRLRLLAEERMAELKRANEQLETVVAEHQRTEDQLRKLARIVEQAPLSVAITDLAGAIEYVNPTFCRVTGYTREEVQGQNPRILKSGITPPEVYADLWKTLTSGKVWRGELNNRKKSGEVFVELSVIAPVVNPDGRVTDYVALKEDITQRKLADEALASSLREKEGLLREVHHRVKNNLAMIVSLMHLEARRSNQPETQTVLLEMQGRVRSVALLNEALYRTESYNVVNLADYLRQLATSLFQAQAASSGAVRLVLDLDPIYVATKQAVPCGLIVNELITNSLKHAFADGRSGEVRVLLGEEAGGQATLRVSDTGAGMPADFEAKRAQSLGLQLVADLARQLKGTLEIGPGATFTIAFSPRRESDSGEIPRPF